MLMHCLDHLLALRKGGPDLVHSRLGYQKWEDLQIACTFSGSEGDLPIFTFLTTYVFSKKSLQLQTDIWLPTCPHEPLHLTKKYVCIYGLTMASAIVVMGCCTAQGAECQVWAMQQTHNCVWIAYLFVLYTLSWRVIRQTMNIREVHIHIKLKDALLVCRIHTYVIPLQMPL